MGDSRGTMDPMIFLDDADTYLVARSRRDMLDALLDHLPEEPEVWQLKMIGAACLGHREPLAVVVEEL